MSVGSLMCFVQPSAIYASFGRTTGLNEVWRRCPYGLELIATKILLQGRQKYLCPPFSESVLKPLCALLRVMVAERLGCLAAISSIAMPIQSEEKHSVGGSSNYVG